MARTAITAHAVGRTGTRTITMTAGDSTNNHEFTHGANRILLVRNGSGASINVTVLAPQKIDGMSLAGLVVAVAAGATAVIGPFPERTYMQTDGKVYVNLSAGTSVELAVICP